jgi:hypothetical protein
MGLSTGQLSHLTKNLISQAAAKNGLFPQSQQNDTPISVFLSLCLSLSILCRKTGILSRPHHTKWVCDKYSLSLVKSNTTTTTHGRRQPQFFPFPFIFAIPNDSGEKTDDFSFSVGLVKNLPSSAQLSLSSLPSPFKSQKKNIYRLKFSIAGISPRGFLL